MKIGLPPKWFNQHGLKMLLGGGNQIVTPLEGDSVLVGNHIAQLQICETLNRAEYKVLWCITLFYKQYAMGEIILSQTTLERAFGITKDVPTQSTFAEKFDTDDGEQGQFIRNGSFLNIPMPGTGMDGDPNISLFVSDEIRQAVREFIDSQR